MIKYVWSSLLCMAILYGLLFAVTLNPWFLLNATVLSIMEIAVSFDNAIVNAAIMKNMTPFWCRMFTTVGMLIAVGFMRFLLPIIIVAMVGNLSFSTATTLAFTDIHQFSVILDSSHTLIAGFGGAFLMMIALRYFINSRDDYWITPVESSLAKLEPLTDIRVLIVALFAMVIAVLLKSDRIAFIIAVGVGVTANILIELLKTGTTALNDNIGHKVGKMATAGVISGLLSLLYLETIDASFSFDGVIAAFALTDNILIVAVGLGTGAAFVRSLTLYLVDTGTLAEYKYLESGAYWAIGGLSVFMFLGAVISIPNWVTAGYGGTMIALAFAHSLYSNWQERKALDNAKCSPTTTFTSATV